MSFLGDLKIGTQSKPLPPLSLGSVEAAPMNNVGMVGFFERGTTDTPMVIEDFATINMRVGRHVHNHFGRYMVDSFVRALQGSGATLYIQRVVGAGAEPSVANVLSVGTEPKLLLAAGQKGEDDPGTWGNSLRYTLVHSSRAESEVVGAAAIGDTVVSVDAAAVFDVGDIVHFHTSDTHYFIESIDEVENTVTLTSPLTVGLVDEEVVSVLDYTIQFWRRDDDTGQIEPVEERWSNVSLHPLSPHNIRFSISDAEEGSWYVNATVLETLDDGTANEILVPTGTNVNDVSTVVALSGGANGATPSHTDITASFQRFNDVENMTFLIVCESHSELMADDLEEYCKIRRDTTGIAVPAFGLATETHKRWINRRRKSRQIYCKYMRDWISVDDPLGTGLSPRIYIPSTALIAGYSFAMWSNRGIHKAVHSTTVELPGVRSIYNPINDRRVWTDLGTLGLNVIIETNGSFYPRSDVAASKIPAYRFNNGQMMAFYFMRSFAQSLGNYEGEPNKEAALKSIVSDMRAFAESFYVGSSIGDSSSGGGFAEGAFDEVCKFEYGDHINPKSRMQKGIFEVRQYFAYPTPIMAIVFGVSHNLDLEG